MRPKIFEFDAAGSVVVPLDYKLGEFHVGVYLSIGGTSEVDVEITADNVQAEGYDPNNGHWAFPPESDGDGDGITQSGVLHITTPATALRITVTTDDVVVAQVLQSGTTSA